MAIAVIGTEWLSHLASKGAFRPGGSLLDLGPQDVQIPKRLLRAIALRHQPEQRCDALLDQMFDGDAFRRTAQQAFYAVFGVDDYRSLDIEDDRADFKVDLNYPVPPIGQFDVVTNFGTFEHVFNIGQTFASIHDMLSPGGVALHVMPGFAFMNHGFYNVNPNLYVEVARANGYELLDFSYIDNLWVRDEVLKRQGYEEFRFEALPIRIEDMESTRTFLNKVVSLYYSNLVAQQTRDVLSQLSPQTAGPPAPPYPGSDFHVCFVFDLCFVALRKTRAGTGNFVMPTQDMFGVPPLPARDAARS